MRIRRVGECIPDSERKIRKEVQGMLRACDIYEPPTPVDRLLEYRQLTRQEQLEAQPGPIRHLFKTIRHKIVGFLDLQSNLVAIDPNLHPARQKFLTYHEVGHDVMPWHRKLFIVTSEWHLKPSVRRKFEAEANRFAGHSIFQLDDMARGLRGRRLRMADLGGIAARYGASLTSTVRQYVVVQDSSCALLVGEPTGSSSTDHGIQFRYGVATDDFVQQFGTEGLGDKLAPEHPICTCLNESGANPSEALLWMQDVGGELYEVRADTLYNTYETLTLLHPRRPKRTILGWRRTVSGNGAALYTSD